MKNSQDPGDLANWAANARPIERRFVGSPRKRPTSEVVTAAIDTCVGEDLIRTPANQTVGALISVFLDRGPNSWIRGKALEILNQHLGDSPAHVTAVDRMCELIFD